MTSLVFPNATYALYGLIISYPGVPRGARGGTHGRCLYMRAISGKVGYPSNLPCHGDSTAAVDEITAKACSCGHSFDVSYALLRLQMSHISLKPEYRSSMKAIFKTPSPPLPPPPLPTSTAHPHHPLITVTMYYFNNIAIKCKGIQR